jgi:hypothetical protein
MKKITFFVGFLVFIAGLIYSIPTDEQVRQAATIFGVPFADLKQFVQSYQTRNAPPGTIQIEPTQILNEYKENQFSSDMKYKSKTLQISGKVNSIRTDLYDEYYIYMEPCEIRIYVQSGELTKLANLSKGQTITIVGKCDSYSYGILKIIDTYIVK